MRKQRQGPDGNLAGTRPWWSRRLRPASLYFFLALFLFACGLMSKPMVVTLPFVLLLLDYWPLRRFTKMDLRKGTSSPLTLSLSPSSAFAALRRDMDGERVSAGPVRDIS